MSLITLLCWMLTLVAVALLAIWFFDKRFKASSKPPYVSSAEEREKKLEEAKRWLQSKY